MSVQSSHRTRRESAINAQTLDEVTRIRPLTTLMIALVARHCQFRG
jgi:hypothetical protein